MYRTVEVEVEVDLADFDTQELLDELESRGQNFCFSSSLLTKIYEKRIMGIDYQQELDELIWQSLGRM